MGIDDIVASYRHPVRKNERVRLDEDRPRKSETSAQRAKKEMDKMGTSEKTGLKLRKLFEDRLADF